MEPDVVFEHFGHQAVDSAAHVCQQHKDVRAIVARGQGALDGVDLATDPLDAGDEFLRFFFEMGHNLTDSILDDILGGYGRNDVWGVSPAPRERLDNSMSKQSAQEPPSTGSSSLCCDERLENRL